MLNLGAVYTSSSHQESDVYFFFKKKSEADFSFTGRFCYRLIHTYEDEV